jgi:hypothetical protein
MRFMLAVILVFVLIFTSCSTDKCGNHALDDKETSASCCVDAGCPDEQQCLNNACSACGANQHFNTTTKTCVQNILCKSCQYLEGNACIDYPCCDDIHCDDTKTCKNHVCTPVVCTGCSYPQGHDCVTYPCCDDRDCNDQDATTKDTCLHPKTVTAECTNKALDACLKNSDCNDRDTTTIDTCEGTPKSCTHTTITDCVDHDNYCPPLCTYKDDTDCTEEDIFCKNDNLACFTDAATDCIMSRINVTSDNSTDDVFMNITTFVQVKEEDNGICIVGFKIRTIDFEFTDDYRQALEDDNLTNAQIDNKENDAADKVTSIEGDTWTCDFEDTNDLVNVLNHWKKHEYYLSDLNSYDCTGDHFK